MLPDQHLTPSQLQTILQGITITALGNGWSPENVRIEWPVGGAPAFPNTKNVCFIGAVNSEEGEDEDYGALREVQYFGPSSPPATCTEQTWYTATWRMEWIFYGPSAFDNARIVRSAMFKQQFNDLFASNNLYMVMETKRPKRIVERFQFNWWERCDWSARFNELVIENDTVNTVKSVEVKIYDQTSPSIAEPLADFTVT